MFGYLYGSTAFFLNEKILVSRREFNLNFYGPRKILTYFFLRAWMIANRSFSIMPRLVALPRLFFLRKIRFTMFGN